MLLVSDVTKTESGAVLAAVKCRTDNSEQKLRNQKTLEGAKAASMWCGDKLHVVNAYKDSRSHPYRGSLLRHAQVDNANLHIAQGESAGVIASVALGTQAELVVVGTKGHSHNFNNIQPAKIERLLSLIDVDVLVVNTK